MPDPVGPSDPPPIIVLPSLPSFPSTPSGPSSLTTDSTAQASAPPRMDLLSFLKAVGEPKQDLNTVQWQVQQDRAQSRNSFHIALVNSSLASLQQFFILVNLFSAVAPVSTQNDSNIAAYNAAIVNYNTNTNPADVAAINTMNQAITDFNNHSITLAQYNAAKATYASYVTTRNGSPDVTTANAAKSTFNSDTASVNAAIDNINTQFDSNISHQTPVTATTTLPSVPGGPQGSIPLMALPSLLPNQTNTIVPAATAILDKAIQIIITFITLLLAGFNQLEILGDFSDYVQFILQDFVATLPPEFVTPAPDLLVGDPGSGTGSGSSVNLLLYVASLSSGLLSSIIGRAQGDLNYAYDLQALYGANTKSIALTTSTQLAQLGLLAGSSSVRLLADRLPFVDIRSSPVALALGQTYASEITNAVQAGVTKNVVNRILTETFPNVSANTLQELNLNLSSAAELFQLQVGVLLLAQSLGLPQLFASLLATLPDAAALNIFNPVPTFGSFFQSPANVTNLQNALASNLKTQLNISDDRARFLAVLSANNAVNANATSNASALQGSILNTLVAQGYTEESAQAAASLASSVVQAELIGRNILDTRFSTEQLKGTILANEQVKSILANNTVETNRQLRDLLAAAFVANGQAAGAALIAATRAVAGNNVATPTFTLDQLKAEVRAKAEKLYAPLGPEKADKMAQDLVNELLGSDNSLRSLLNDRIQTIIRLNDQNATNALNDQLRAFLAPTVETAAFAQRLTDPANTLLISAQTSITHGRMDQAAHSKDRGQVDILI